MCYTAYPVLLLSPPALPNVQEDLIRHDNSRVDSATRVISLVRVALLSKKAFAMRLR